MNFQRPLSLISHPLDSEILAVLARADKSFTGREVQRAAGASHDGVRLALQRLVGQGIVQSEQAGRAIMYRLNRDHLAAEYVEALASLRLELIERLRQEITNWRIAPILAMLFGSVARGDATEESDVDIFVVRPSAITQDEPTWRDQLGALEDHVTRWTGNDARTLELGERELAKARKGEPVVRDIAREGLPLFGDPSVLRKTTQTNPRIDVLPDPTGGWRVRIGEQSRANVYRTKTDARRAGQKAAKASSAELLIHGRDGRILERNVYGEDPYPG